MGILDCGGKSGKALDATWSFGNDKTVRRSISMRADRKDEDGGRWCPEHGFMGGRTDILIKVEGGDQAGETG